MQAVTPLTPSDTSSFTDLTEFGEDEALGDVPVESELSTELPPLESLFPVVNLLPGLTREKGSGYYYLQGKIEASDQEALYSYTKRIGDLTLGAEPDSEPRLAPHVLARIARLQDPNTPLFPLLHRLRIVDTSSSLNFLDLLLSSALTMLELTAIPTSDPCYSSVLSFLECAIYQAPHLSTLILGPGHIQDQILDLSSSHKNLRRLELLDVQISISSQFLQDIGSLRHLETFVLRDKGTSTYVRSPAIPAFGEIVGSTLFSALRTLEVGGTFDLIEDLVAGITSSDLRALSIDITKPLERIPVPVGIRGKNKKTSPSSGAAFTFGRPSIISSPTPQPPTPPQISTTDIMTLLRRSIQKWPNTLVSVSFKNDSTVSFSLLPDIFEDLLLRPDMKHLEISGMDIGSMDDTLLRLGGVADSKLEDLHLPVHSNASDISPARLRDIAEACSHLKSLRCCLRTWDPNPSVSSPPLSHQLEVLSVRNEQTPQARLDQHLSLGIARYLDAIFPRLKSVKTHNEDGNNTEQWGFIFNLVKSYQAVRMDEHQRL